MAKPLVEIAGLHKSFGPVQVLRGVSLDLHPGEVHALLGENGAGKSTLMKVLSGTYAHGEYEGVIRIDGRETRFSGPAEAAEAGVSIIHQELSVFPTLTVAENLCVGHWPKGRLGAIDWNVIRRRAESWFRENGIQIDTNALMKDLSAGAQQLVEIAKALLRDARVIILDEPTSSLSPQEAGRLFALMASLRAQGKALVYISHRMEEVFRHCDRATVLRDGQSVLSTLTRETEPAQLIAAMVGRPLDRLFPARARACGEEPVLEVSGFRATHRRNGRSYGPISFSLRKGEILGLGGLLGAGRSELMQALLGSGEFRSSGELAHQGRRKRWASPGAAFRDGVVIVGEDRRRDSLFPQRTIEENSSMLALMLRGLGGGVRPTREASRALEELRRLRTRYRDLGQRISELSGGNQQKVIFSRVLQAAPNVLVLDEPTRGVDVGAKAEIYEILLGLADQGMSVLLVSSDLPELMALSDRVLVLCEGRQTGLLARHEINEERIMGLAIERGVAHA